MKQALFGEIGDLAGACQEMMHFMADGVPGSEYQPQSWRRTDAEALDALVELEAALEPSPGIAPASDLTLDEKSEVCQAFNTEVETYRAGLPFSEVERRWLCKLVLGTRSHGWRAQQSEIRSASAEVMSSGLRDRISGQDLLRRWWLWRRDAGPYESQAGRRLAWAALAHLAVTVADQPLAQ